jgi:TM2 domain-containing membrane protein YozV/cold shock CspA family protein
MRGKVLAFDERQASGLISGDDGQRYAFTREALQGGVRAAPAGANVDFQIEDGKAANIYVVAYGSEKNRIVAAVLAIFLGHWGVHKFYLGKINAGVIMLLLGTVGWILIIPGIVNWVIAIIEFVIYLTKSDQQFYEDYVAGDRSWF